MNLSLSPNSAIGRSDLFTAARSRGVRLSMVVVVERHNWSDEPLLSGLVIGYPHAHPLFEGASCNPEEAFGCLYIFLKVHWAAFGSLETLPSSWCVLTSHIRPANAFWPARPRKTAI